MLPKQLSAVLQSSKVGVDTIISDCAAMLVEPVLADAYNCCNRDKLSSQLALMPVQKLCVKGGLVARYVRAYLAVLEATKKHNDVLGDMKEQLHEFAKVQELTVAYVTFNTAQCLTKRTETRVADLRGLGQSMELALCPQGMKVLIASFFHVCGDPPKGIDMPQTFVAASEVAPSMHRSGRADQ